MSVRQFENSTAIEASLSFNESSFDGKPSHDTFKSFAETTSDLFISVCFEGRILWVNPATLSSTGWRRAEFTGKRFTDFLHPDDLGIAAGDKNNRPENIERRVLTRTGHYLTIHFSGGNYQAEDGTRGVMWVGRNISAQTQRTEQRFKIAEEGAGIGVWDWDLTNQNIFFSRVYKKMLGCSDDQFPDSVWAWNRLIHPEDRSKVWGALRKSVSGSLSSFSVEYRLKHEDQSYRWILNKGTIFKNAEGKAVRVAGAQWDITARKNIENALSESIRSTAEILSELQTSKTLLENQTKCLERSNRELKQFAYLVSHDLKEPVRMITCYLKLIEDRFGHSIGGDISEFMHYAVSGGKRLVHLLDDLLRYAAVETQDQNFESVCSAGLLRGAIHNLQSEIGNAQATIRFGELPRLPVDPDQGVLLFQNLLGNAIKFRRKEVPLRIEVEAVKTHRELTISVRDNGIGMDEQFKDRIFVIFQRLHGGMYPGTGTGLAICKKIVERHGGSIWVESTAEVGSKFSFSIPTA
jgi:PAS domain S-box-containing protein